MTPERNLIDPARALVEAALHQYRSDMRHPPAPDSRERRIAMIDRALEALAATPKPEPVLRWEGDELWLGNEAVAWVSEHPQGDADWSCYLGSFEDDAPTLAEARTAAERAVRDWLKRAGCV